MPSSAAPPGERKPSVFLSYARADDERFVERLHGDLIHAGIEVWWDRAAMESRARTFLQEIRDAIEGVDRVVAVVGPAAISSQYVLYEWDHALLFAEGIVPICFPAESSRTRGHRALLVSRHSAGRLG